MGGGPHNKVPAAQTAILTVFVQILRQHKAQGGSRHVAGGGLGVSGHGNRLEAASGFIAVVVHLVLADAVAKELAAGYLKGASSLPVIPGFFDLAYVENRGCAWGMFQGQVWPLAAFAVLALAFLLWKRKTIFGDGRAAAVAEVLLYAGIFPCLVILAICSLCSLL